MATVTKTGPWAWGMVLGSAAPGSTTVYAGICLRPVNAQLLRVHLPPKHETNVEITSKLSTYLNHVAHTYTSFTGTAYIPARARVIGQRIRFQVEGPAFNRPWGAEFEHDAAVFPTAGIPTMPAGTAGLTPAPPSGPLSLPFPTPDGLVEDLLIAQPAGTIAVAQMPTLPAPGDVLVKGDHVILIALPPDAYGHYGPKLGMTGTILVMRPEEHTKQTFYGVAFPQLTTGHVLHGLCPPGQGWTVPGQCLAKVEAHP